MAQLRDRFLRPARPPRAWRVLTEAFHWPDALATALWKALSASEDPEARAICYQVERLPQDRSHATAHHLVMAQLSPKRFIGLIERLVDTRHLTRATATQFEEACLLPLTNRDGGWK